MSYSPIAIANYYIDKANFEESPLDHLRLQKLVYLAHGWYLALYGEPLIDEPVEAWKYGPVTPSLYHKFKRHGMDPIDENGVEFNGLRLTVPNIDFDDKRTRALLDRVWDVYKKYTGIQLSNMTHEPGTPWSRIWPRRKRRSVKIPDAVIAEHFQEKARRGQKSQAQ